MMFMVGKRPFKTIQISLRAAPVSELMTPMVLGNLGKGFLCCGSNKPSAASLFFN